VQIIPVIDLMHGQVVHAKRGQRNQYLPIQSPLCPSSEPLEVVAGLMKLYPFRTLYIADIDAIQNTGHHHAIIERISQTYPDSMVWIDCGSNNPTLLTNSSTLVLGSESIHNLKSYVALTDPYILSLDYNAQGAIGLSDLHQSSKLWPDHVICMTLNNVGSAQGVDIKTLMQLITLNKSREKPSSIYAAGGVRNIDDIKTLTKMGITGALVATALHQGQITGADIVKIHRQ